MPNPVPQIFAPRRLVQRRARADARQALPGAARWLGEAMADDVLERLDFVRFKGDQALVAGIGAATLDEGLHARGWQLARRHDETFEHPVTGVRYELIAILGVLDTINDLPGALLHLRGALAPGGLLLASMIGAGSLPRLRQAMLAADGSRPAARVHPLVDAQAASGLLQRAGFARQVTDHFALTVRYGALQRLVADLRDQGAGSALRDRAPPLGRHAWAIANRAFMDQADPDGRVSERFEIVTLTAWRD